jgi:hypothetical protein
MGAVLFFGLSLLIGFRAFFKVIPGPIHIYWRERLYLALGRFIEG